MTTSVRRVRTEVRLRLAAFLLFLIPVSLMFGEMPVFRFGTLPLYWFELGTILFAFLAGPEIWKGRDVLRQVNPLIRWGVLLLVPALIISTAHASDVHAALGASIAWFVVPVLLGAMIIASGISLEPLAYGIVTHAFLQIWYGSTLLSLQAEPRLMGTFASPNFFAAVVVPAAFIALLLPIRGRILLSLLLVFGLIASQSLGGFIGLLVAGIVLAIQQIKLPKVRVLLMVSVIVIGLLGGGLAYVRFANNPRSSLASREQIWRTAVKLIEERPVVGLGLRNFAPHYTETVGTVVANPIEWNAPEPHNLYLAFWLDLSLIGLIAMVLIAGGVLQGGGIAVLPIVAVLAHGLVDTPIFKLELAVLFWLYVALAIYWRGRRTPRILE